MVGAAADEGRSLDELVAIGERAAECARSVAVARRAHTAPGTGRLAFELSQGEIDFGIGIHGERAATTAMQEPLPQLVSRMVDRVLGALPQEHSRVIAIVNGLGGVANLELFAIAAELAKALFSRSIALEARAVGTFVPALDMAGFSITLAAVDDELAGLWAAPTAAPGWAAIRA